MIKNQTITIIIEAGCDFPGCPRVIRVEGRNVGECYQKIRAEKWVIRKYGSYCRCIQHKFRHAGAHS